jgi:hypothetical protein
MIYNALPDHTFALRITFIAKNNFFKLLNKNKYLLSIVQYRHETLKKKKKSVFYGSFFFLLFLSSFRRHSFFSFRKKD